MVSLFDLCLQVSAWSHISTGLPSLDALLTIQSSESILDFQTVPLNNFMNAVLSNIIASHLRHTSHRSVVIIETSNPFQLSLLKQHLDFEPSWLERVRQFRLDSFPQVLSFFMLNPLRDEGDSTLILITNFHELLDYYKLQLSATYEEALLRLQIEYNGTIIDNLDKVRENGLNSIDLPQLPPNSDLLRVHPTLKYHDHVNEMFKQMGNFIHKHHLLLILVGGMNTGTVNVGASLQIFASQLSPSRYSLTPEYSPQSQSEPQNERVQVLEPMTFDRKDYMNRNLLQRKGLNESKISFRLLFYFEPYQKTPYYQLQGQKSSSQNRTVAAVKVTKMVGDGNINDPVYFDFWDNFYVSEESPTINNWLIDLLDCRDEGFTSFLQESISSTQLQMRPLSERVPERRSQLGLLQIPSSPVTTDNPRKRPYSAGDTSPQTHPEEEILVIQASDNELTGTLLEDLL